MIRDEWERLAVRAGRFDGIRKQCRDISKAVERRNGLFRSYVRKVTGGFDGL